MNSPYSREEVEALVEHYSKVVGRKDTAPKSMWITVRLFDLGQALTRLEPVQWEAVVLCGVLELPYREVGTLLDVSHVTAWQRYKSGILRLTELMNGEGGQTAPFLVPEWCLPTLPQARPGGAPGHRWPCSRAG